MSYLNLFRQRILSSGNKPTDGIVNASKQTIKNNFSNSLFSEIVLINGMEYEAIITQDKKSEDKKLLLLPDVQVDIGSVVELNSNLYLIMDFQGEGINEIYPSATLKKCNNTYPIKVNKTSQLKGHNQLGKPVYEDVYSVDKLEPCIVESGNFATDTDSQLVIPKNTLFITLKYQLSDTINYNYEFTMYNNKYKIKDIDYTKVINEKGIIKLIAERV
jgi:hypothetical protein